MRVFQFVKFKYVFSLSMWIQNSMLLLKLKETKSTKKINLLNHVPLCKKWVKE